MQNGLWFRPIQESNLLVIASEGNVQEESKDLALAAKNSVDGFLRYACLLSNGIDSCADVSALNEEPVGGPGDLQARLTGLL